MKVVTVVGTRPEVIKLSRVIAELDARIEHVVIHTGQNYDYELNEVFFEQLGLRPPDHVLGAAAASSAETIGQVIARVDRVLESERPEAMLVLGDTDSALSVIAAKRRKIPIFHMEAGNRSFDERVPEEVNRRIVDHTSDVNLPYTEHARRNLEREGIRPDLIVKTHSPLREVLEYYRPGIEASDVLGRFSLARGEYFVVSCHRAENVDDPERLALFVEMLHALVGTYGRSVVMSTHPRTRERLEQAGVDMACPGPVRFLKPLGFLDYVKLETEAACVLSDSGTLTEESSILGFPAVTIRESHERPEGMDEGTLILCGLRPARVLEAVKVVMDQTSAAASPFRSVADYESACVSRKVVRIILSYVDYVNRTVWSRVG
jgi:UDP-N-acetylglucosamine 2-epimerase (non-hydrolysing)